MVASKFYGAALAAALMINIPAAAQAASVGDAADSVLLNRPLPELTQVAMLDSGIIAADDARTVDSMLTAAGLTIDDVREGETLVPRLYVAAMPDDMGEISQTADKKRIFIKLMLPLVLNANERILADRAQLLYLKTMIEMGQEITNEDALWLVDLAALYYVDEGDLDELVRRVDVIPPSLALAQAALESGWGTSRFAHEGNAVFGQRSWDEDDGIVPEDRPADQTHVVRSFDGLRDSVFAYLVNLNRHQAYEHLRELRVGLHNQDLPLDGWTLADGLDDYAEHPGYVDLVRSVIRQNRLTDFDAARLADLAI